MDYEPVDYSILLKNTLNELLVLLAGDADSGNEENSIRINLVRTAIDYAFYLEDRSK